MIDPDHRHRIYRVCRHLERGDIERSLRGGVLDSIGALTVPCAPADDRLDEPRGRSDAEVFEGCLAAFTVDLAKLQDRNSTNGVGQ